jgi:very-short-patch-repair endonuclease
LRAALEEIRAGIRSGPESDLRRLIRREKIPMPVFNARLYAGRTLIAVVDAWWEEARLGAKVDSKEYHFSAGNWPRSLARHDRLVARGVSLLHFTPQRIRTEPDQVAAKIWAALASGCDRERLTITTKPSG